MTTSENGEIPTQGFCLNNFAMVKDSSGGGSEMELDSRSPRKRNVSFPLVFTLNLSPISLYGKEYPFSDYLFSNFH